MKQSLKLQNNKKKVCEKSESAKYFPEGSEKFPKRPNQNSRVDGLKRCDTVAICVIVEASLRVGASNLFILAI